MNFETRMKLALNVSFDDHRTEFMGFAAIWVALMHVVSELFPSVHIPVLGAIIARGNLGVEMFLALSGFGLFCSLEKNHDVKRFYKRRISRIIGPWLALGLVYWLVSGMLTDSIGFWWFFNNCLGISFWKDGVTTIWYVAYIALLYLLYPLIYKLQKKNAQYILLLSAILVLVNLFLWNYTESFYANTEIALTRTPIFLVGSYIAQFVKYPSLSGKKAGWWILAYLIVTVTAFAGSIFARPYHRDFAVMLYRYGGGGAVLILMIVVGKILSLLELPILKKALSFYGGISLEFYLISVFLRNIIGYLISDYAFPPYVCLSISAGVFAISSIAAKFSHERFKFIRIS